MVLRALVPADFRALRGLWALGGEGASLGLSGADEQPAIVRFLQRNPGLSLGLWSDDRLIGSVLVGEDARRGYLYHAVVHPAYRGRGYGRLLVAEAVRLLRARGVQKVHVMVYTSNTGGRDFWRHLGFVPRDELVVLSKETAKDDGLSGTLARDGDDRAHAGGPLDPRGAEE